MNTPTTGLDSASTGAPAGIDAHKKRLVFCFDGTWNQLGTDAPTNVVLLSEMIEPVAKDGTPQIVHYDEGIGTWKLERFTGGAFGAGMMRILRAAYRFLIFNYRPGDEIFVFGFSRGAFTARSFVGFIRHVGILDVVSATQIDKAIGIYKGVQTEGDDSVKALEFRAANSRQVCVSKQEFDWRMRDVDGFRDNPAPILDIAYVGVWDSVAALGVPKFIPGATRWNRRHSHHKVKLTSKVKKARHAIAIDERRILFEPVIWNNVAELNGDCGYAVDAGDAPYQQKWFPGVHGSVGGGGSVRGLSDGALAWVLAGAKEAGLEIRTGSTARAYELAPNPFAALRNEGTLTWHDRGPFGWFKRFALSTDRVGPDDFANVAPATRRRWAAGATMLPEGRQYRPKTLGEVSGYLDKWSLGVGIKSLRPTEDYVVLPGDTLGTIAEKILGNAARYTEIFELNRDQLDSPDAIFAWSTLRVPKREP